MLHYFIGFRLLITLFWVVLLAGVSDSTWPEPMSWQQGDKLADLINVHRRNAGLQVLRWDVDEFSYRAELELRENKDANNNYKVCTHDDYTEKKFRDKWETQFDNPKSGYTIYSESAETQTDPTKINLTQAAMKWYSGNDDFKYDPYSVMGCLDENDYWDSINFITIMYHRASKMGCALLHCDQTTNQYARNVIYCTYNAMAGKGEPIFEQEQFLELCVNEKDVQWDTCTDYMEDLCEGRTLPTWAPPSTTPTKKTTTTKKKPKPTKSTQRPTKKPRVKKVLTTPPGGIIQVEGKNLSEEKRKSLAASLGPGIVFGVLFCRYFMSSDREILRN